MIFHYIYYIIRIVKLSIWEVEFVSLYNRKNHRKILLQAHVIFVTKYRKKIINGKINEYLKEILSKVAVDN